MESPVVFNWPSGASGDFIISCADLLNGKDVEFNKISNQWNHQQDPEKYIRQFSHPDRIIDWNNIPNNKVVCMHDLPNEIERPGFNLPQNLMLVNIDGAEQQSYITLLYLMKSNSGNDEDIKISHLNDSSFIADHYKDRKNFLNFKFYDLFFKQDRDQIRQVVSTIAKKEVNEEEADDLVKLFELYHNLNQVRVRHQSYQSIGGMLDMVTLKQDCPNTHVDNLKHAILKLQDIHNDY
jgi:hypothetical protein